MRRNQFLIRHLHDLIPSPPPIGPDLSGETLSCQRQKANNSHYHQSKQDITCYLECYSIFVELLAPDVPYNYLITNLGSGSDEN